MCRRPEKGIPPNSRGRLFVQSLLLLPLAATALKLFGFKRSYVILGRLFSLQNNSAAFSDHSSAAARRVAQTVKSANRFYAPLTFSCLSESLGLWCLLRHRGIPAQFRLGVRTLTGPFESHAWVEYHNEVLNDIENIGDIYAPFDLSAIITK